MSRLVPIENIQIDPDLGLMVQPKGEAFEFIYRAASGIRWNVETNALVTYEPKRWNTVDLFQQIFCAVWSEYGRLLIATQETRWTNIPKDIKTQIIDSAAKLNDQLNKT